MRHAVSITLLMVVLSSCGTSRSPSNSNQGGMDFRELNNPLFNDINLLGYNGYQLTLGLMDNLCSSDSLVGYERGFQLAFGLKRDQLNSLELDTNGQEYRRLAQQLDGYSVQWEILNQDLTTACRTRAFCIITEMNANSGSESRTDTTRTDNTTTTVTIDDPATVTPQACSNAESDYDRRVQAARDFVLRITELEMQTQ